MATMASTSHGLSVWANNCVKNPINPKTGLSSTVPDRCRSSIRYSDNFNDIDLGMARVLFEGEGDAAEEWVANHRSDIDLDVNSKLQAATESEFYEKLQLLKEENKKTLDAYDKLYKEKMLLGGIYLGEPATFQPDKSGFDREVDPESSTGSRIVGIITKKPPPGKQFTSDAPLLSKTLPQHSANVRCARKERPGSAPVQRKSRSLDQDDWSKLCLDEDFIIPGSNTNEYEKALSKVDQLWENFKISEYTQRRHSFSSKEDEKKTKSTSKEWRHRITIPQPFNMSIREALKEKKKTSAQMELEHMRREKQREEEAECEKKFKAQPVPSHIYLPLYEDIMEKNETRRKYVKEYCKDMLRSQVKPFNFELRENERKLQRAQSAPKQRPEKHMKNGFKANPIPKRIIDPRVEEKLMAEEELRKIRVKMRAKELLRDSSLPPNMAAREKLKEMQKKEQIIKAKKSAAKKKRPRSAHVVPDYDILHREFQKELSRRRSIREGTVVEPFDLETGRIRQSSQERILRDMEADEKNLKENRWPFQSSRMTPRSSLKYLGALSTSLDAIPSSSTKAADLRATITKKEKERMAHRLIEEEEAEKRRMARETKLRRFLNERTTCENIPKPRDSIAARLKKIKQEDRERQEAYQRDIEEMKMRVEQSPLLVEKYMAENAKKEAEKKFTTTVRRAGLNDSEFAKTRDLDLGSTAHSGWTNYSDNDYNEEEMIGETASSDLTYIKATTSGGEED